MSDVRPAARKDSLPDNAAHILVVDDDQRIRDLLSRYLQEHGFRVTPASDAASAKAAMRGLTFDLIILDVMMPGQSGMDFARELKQTMDIPICMLTAMDQKEDRLVGMEAGVDDYIVKPFEPRELLIRMRNILRRGRPMPPMEDIKMGAYVFNIARGELKKGDETIKLTERERDLLRQFAAKSGLPIARHELAPDESTGSERAIDVQINRLRRKIERDPANPLFLQAVRGIGYRLVASP